MTPFYDDGRVLVHVGHVLDVLAQMPAGSIQTVVTSPPYYGLRSYSTEPQVWGGDPSCSHSLDETAPGKVLTGGTGTASAKQVSNVGSQCGNAWSETERVVPSPVMSAKSGLIAGANPTTPDGKYESQREPQRIVSATCTRCGAWRGELGSEPDPSMYVAHIVEVFRGVRRVLHDTGTVWCNLGDSYAGSGKGTPGPNALINHSQRQGFVGAGREARDGSAETRATGAVPAGLKPKDLVGIPWRVAFALQADGWYLRSDIIWSKPNPMPESVTDRPTKAHEYLFLLSKQPVYYYDAEAIREPYKPESLGRYAYSLDGTAPTARQPQNGDVDRRKREAGVRDPNPAGRNRRSVWTIPTESYPAAHFACVDADTECLTIHGWQRHETLTAGTLAAQYDRATELLSWAPIEAVARYEVTDQPMVVAQSRDVQFWLTPNHRTLVQRRHPTNRAWQVVTEIRADELKPSHAIPVSASWEEGGETPFDEDWAELLGWYLAEGCETVASWAVEIYQSKSANPAKVDRIRELLTLVGAEFREATAGRTWRGQPSSLTAFRIQGYAAVALRQWAPGKQFHPDTLRWSTPILTRLLVGLIDGDGHRRPDGRSTFIQRSREGAGMAQAIGVRLGYATMLTRRSEGTYSVYFTHKRQISLRGTNGEGAQIDQQLYTGVVWCPSLPAGTWVARRNGRPFITGNTFPRKLVEPCILAGTSARGQCPECRAPWRRCSEPTPEYAQRLAQRPYKDELDVDAFRAYLHECRERAGLSKAAIDAALGTNTAYAWWEGRNYLGEFTQQIPTWDLYVRLKAVLGMDDRYDEGLQRYRVRLEGAWQQLAADPSLEGNRKSGGGDPPRANITTGWGPSCPCDAGDPVPQIVLDIFAGSGTTLAVARDHARRAIGVELNPGYAKLVTDRLKQGTLGLEVY